MPERNVRTAVLTSALHRRAFLLLAGTVGALVAAVLILALGSRGDGGTPARELVITAQDIRFNGTNPPLELQLGEKVALTIVNQEAGIVHDFAISGLNVRSRGYLHPGMSQTLVFTPGKAGVFRYGCTLHPGLMDGQVIVQRQ